MLEGIARPRGVLITACVLLSIAPLSILLGQSRAQSRGQRSAPTREVPARGAGTVAAPEAGYVTAPEPVPAGTLRPALIPPDEFDRAYWELYDRDKHVTISGKVTRVNWTNPNAYIFVQTSSAEWAVEASYIQFRQASVTPAVRENQTISIAGYLAKEDPNPKWPVKSSPSVTPYRKEKRLIRAAEITTEYGQKLRLGKPQSEAEEAEELLKCSRLGC
jgi:hypothetical protein